jgi:hypothetical protein
MHNYDIDFEELLLKDYGLAKEKIIIYENHL